VLLAFLAVSPGGRASRRKLTALLWGEAGDETSLDNLRVCVWSLRKALGDTQHQVIASDGEENCARKTLKDLEVPPYVLAFQRLALHLAGPSWSGSEPLRWGVFSKGLRPQQRRHCESWRRENSDALSETKRSMF
jgi:hypothetical protein